MLSSALQDLQSAQSVKVLIFIEQIGKTKELIAVEAGKGTEAMEGIKNKEKTKTGFLYCPRCGLRKLKNAIVGYYAGYCPSCGTRMEEESQFLSTSGKTEYSEQIFSYLPKKEMIYKSSNYI